MEPITVYVLLYRDQVEAVYLDRSTAESAIDEWLTKFGEPDFFYIEETSLIG